MTFVDTNILLDLVTDDPQWADWSVWQLERAETSGTLGINDLIYAELSVRFAIIEAVEEFIIQARLSILAMPRAALSLAAKAFQRYRSAGGTRIGVLPDFFIGAHAAIAGIPLLIRDPQRYHTYFPKLRLIAP